MNTASAQLHAALLDIQDPPLLELPESDLGNDTKAREHGRTSEVLSAGGQVVDLTQVALGHKVLDLHLHIVIHVHVGPARSGSCGGTCRGVLGGHRGEHGWVDDVERVQNVLSARGFLVVAMATDGLSQPETEASS